MTSNPRNIQWPQDTAGFLYQLKNAGVKAVERQMGNEEKHAALMGTLKEIADHAVARYKMQAAVRQAQKDAAAAYDAANLDTVADEIVEPIQEVIPPVQGPLLPAISKKEVPVVPTT